MEELGLDPATATHWFQQQQALPFVLINVDPKQAKFWVFALRDVVRRCYIEDQLVLSKASEHGLPNETIVASRLPDPGSTMAGDFGEIIVYIYQAAKAYPKKLIGPKKWRLKQDRTKPAPYSDVVHFFLPQWPSATSEDAIFCAEVKTKSTAAASDPISSAIADSAKDRTSRLAKTLMWLRERALTQDLGSVGLEQLARFINATESPPAKRHFNAVAVICASLVQSELEMMKPSEADARSLIVVAVPNLKDTYTAVFEAAREFTLEGGGQ